MFLAVEIFVVQSVNVDVDIYLCVYCNSLFVCECVYFFHVLARHCFFLKATSCKDIM